MNWKQAIFLGSWPSLDLLPKKFQHELAFVGRSNVGKSSLINALCWQTKLAKVSATPGKTQEFVFFDIAKRCHLVDLPGYGYAKVSHTLKRSWDQLENYLTTRADACLLLLDSRHGLTENDRQFLTWLQHHKLPHLIIWTKADKLSQKELALAKREFTKIFDAPPLILHQGDSSTLEYLRKEIEQLLSKLPAPYLKKTHVSTLQSPPLEC